MQLPVKLAIGSLSALFLIIILGFVSFPKLISSKVKGMINLGPGTDIRGMFLKVPFALTFRIYIFNVTNPERIQMGEIPILKEVGPFCYEEWKEKMNVEDVEINDTISYNPKDTFLKKRWPGCKTGQEEITVPHPMILGVVNTVMRQKPGALSLVNKAMKSIYANPTSIFLTTTADNILFDGISINCNVSDFAGKAMCSQLKASNTIKQISDEELSFSLLGPKNATLQPRIKAYRGTKIYQDVGRIVEYAGSSKLDIWSTEKCNEIKGTDGTIFPPFLEKEQGLMSYSPDLCRSLGAYFVKDAKYDGIPCGEYTATFGDMSSNEDEKCYCPTIDSCLKKGIMDLYKCTGIPLYASLPHFYGADQSYSNGVKGLTPNKTKHEIKILFESTTGSPLYAKKRIQFSMPLEPVQKVELFNNFTATTFPVFWVEEGVELNKTYTGQLKSLFLLKKVVGVSSWMILLASLAGLAAAGYMFYKNNGKTEITPIHEVKKNGISTINGLEGHVNHGMSENDLNKY
ncbi:unnamed protein product [Phaedon cochleariae]|uniref:Sensory neuron membrane protein 1 n=1 Tax=Phaedon cochleariae TaxID=80249 RepID=A0A9P0DT56_PHACE|nr:unnamed protein product [Phaedon cochleariae]